MFLCSLFLFLCPACPALVCERHDVRVCCLFHEALYLFLWQWLVVVFDTSTQVMMMVGNKTNENG